MNEKQILNLKVFKIRACGITYLKTTNCLYFIGGIDMKCLGIRRNYWISMDAFEDDMIEF